MSAQRASTRTAGVTARYEIPVGPESSEVVSAELWAAGALGVWERDRTLVAWFPSRTSMVPDGGRWSREPDRDWQEAWKATIAPVRAGAIVVVPSWLADTHVEEKGDLTLVLDPGRAFGSGHHATTTMCLELLDEQELEGGRVADVGCGSGILAIAAASRGAAAVAVDIDPEAVDCTRENATRNGVEVDVRLGSVEALPSPAEVVVANLVTDVVVSLAPALTAASTDVLIVSGIASERQARAADALAAAGARVVAVRERDGWVALRARVGATAARAPTGTTTDAEEDA